MTEIGTYGQKQKKPAEEQSKVTKNQWKLSIQSQSAEAPLPERTPESYIIVEDGKFFLVWLTQLFILYC